MQDSAVPERLKQLAGTSVAYDGWWSFNAPKPDDWDPELGVFWNAIQHETAQFPFAISADLEVFVDVGSLVSIFPTVNALVELARWRSSKVPFLRLKVRKNLGEYESIDEFEAARPNIAASESYQYPADTTNKLYIYRRNPVYLCRSYQEDFRLVALHGDG